MSIPAAPVEAAQLRSIGLAWATAAGCLLLGVTLALLIARRVTVPLSRLAHDGEAGLRQPIHVREIALLRDALLAARVHDEAARDGLKRKADEFETLFNNTPIGLAFAQDRECVHVLHNTAMVQLFGPVSSDTPGEPRVFHQGHPLPDEDTPLRVAARSGQAVAMMELEFRFSGRPTIHAIANAVPLRDGQGRPRGAIAAMVDISARKEAEASCSAPPACARAAPGRPGSGGRAGRFLHYQFENDTLCGPPAGQAFRHGHARFESTLGELLGQIHADDRSMMEMALMQTLAARQESANVEYRVGFAGGAVRWLTSRISISYRADGRPQQMVGVTLDITDRKHAEQAGAEVMEREQGARRQAEAANRAKRIPRHAWARVAQAPERHLGGCGGARAARPRPTWR